MDVKDALKEQYHAALAMLAECVEVCPDDMWTAGRHPRTFWRIAYHAVFFTHLYLGQNEDAFQPWTGRKKGYDGMWEKPWVLEPYEFAEEAEVHPRQDILNYIEFV